MSKRRECDILISGGGIAGLTAAAAFGAAGFDVICVDPTPPVTEADADGADLRTTAILQPARALLRQAGVWDALEPLAAALQVMRIVDGGVNETGAREIKSFKASDVSDGPFGWNFPNWRLRGALVSRLNRLPNVDFRPGSATQSLLTRTKEARVSLAGGNRISARLVIAADGRHSTMRQAAGIAVTTRRYGQKALAFAVTHAIPHHNVSTEIHRSGGPFTLVPLPDHDGLPCSAVVWMDEGRLSLARMEAGRDAFEAEMTDRSCNLFGPLKLASRRSIWPIVSQRAHRINATRLALIAEAAHVVPPIGAQGLNMSLADIATLLSLAEKHRGDLGNDDMLTAYQKARYADVRLRCTGIDLLNRFSQASSPVARSARAAGLTALHDVAPVRRGLMKLGMGALPSKDRSL